MSKSLRGSIRFGGAPTSEEEGRMKELKDKSLSGELSEKEWSEFESLKKKVAAKKSVPKKKASLISAQAEAGASERPMGRKKKKKKRLPAPKNLKATVAPQKK
jgi:hypothetical protein